MGQLTDHRDALAFAGEQLESVRSAVREFVDTDPYDLVSEEDPGALTLRLRVKILRPVPPPVRARIGATIMTLRTSLDYLAFELVLANTHRKPQRPKLVEFPIFLNRASYHGSGGAIKKIGEASADAQAEIEWLQPYYGRRALKSRHPLWITHQLCNIHKHRQLTATGGVVGAFGFESSTPIKRALVPGYGIKLGAFDDGALIAQFEGRPGYDLVVNAKSAFTVAFDKKGPGRGATVVEGLLHLRNYIGDVVFPRLEPFL